MLRSLRFYVWGWVGDGNPCTVRSNVLGAYSQLQYIMGNGHMISPVDRQMHMSENITFPQFHWRAVTNS